VGDVVGDFSVLVAGVGFGLVDVVVQSNGVLFAEAESGTDAVDEVDAVGIFGGVAFFSVGG